MPPQDNIPLASENTPTDGDDFTSEFPPDFDRLGPEDESPGAVVPLLPDDPDAWFATFVGPAGKPDDVSTQRARREFSALLPMIVAASAIVRLEWRDAIPAKVMSKGTFDAHMKELTPKRTAGRATSRGPGHTDAPCYYIGTSEFRQLPGRLVEVRKDPDRADQEVLLLPGRLVVPRVVDIAEITRDLAPGPVEDTRFHVIYEPLDAAPRTAVLSDEDMRGRDPKWPTLLTVGSRVEGARLGRLADAIKAMSTEAVRDEGYGATGLLLRPGLAPVFLRQGLPALTAAGFDPRAVAELDPALTAGAGVHALALDDPSTGEQFAADLRVVLRMVDLVPDQPYIPVGILAQLLWSPWSSIDDYGRFATVLAGASGSLKTALCGLIIAAQSRTFVGGKGIEPPVTVAARHGSSSRIGTDRVLYPLAGMTAIVDDLFAGKMDGRGHALAWEYLSSIANNATTGAGGAKGAKVGNGVRADRYPRGCPLFTVEDRLPEEQEHASEVNRTMAFQLEPGAVDAAVLSELQAGSRSLSRAHSGMVQRGLSDITAPRDALAWATGEVEQWTVSGHSRARGIYTRALASLRLFGGHLRDAGGFSDRQVTNMLTEWGGQLEHAANEQARRCGMTSGVQVARDPAALFVKHLVAMFAEGAIYAADPTRRPGPFEDKEKDAPELFAAPVVDGWGPGAFGWRQGGVGWSPPTAGDPIGAVYVASGKGRSPWRPTVLRIRPVTFRETYELLRARVRKLDGWSMPAEDVMRRLLVAAELMKSEDAPRVELWGDRKERVFSLDLGRMLVGGQADEEGPAEGGEPDPEPTGPDADSAPAGSEAALMAPVASAPHAGAGQACATCSTPGKVCGFATSLHRKAEPCTACGDKTWVRTNCGAPRHEACVGARAATPTVTRPADTGRPERKPESTATTRRGDVGKVGVLDAAGVHTAGGIVQVGALPSDLAGLYRLAGEIGVSQLWVHPTAQQAMGLPMEHPVDVSKSAGVPHPLAVLPDGMHADPGGLAPWVVLWEGETRSVNSRSVAFPALDDRAPFGDAADGAELLAAVAMLNGALGADYYRSPNTTAGQLVRRHTNTATGSEMIRNGQVPPASVRLADGVVHGVFRQVVKAGLSRPLTDDEDGAVFVQKYDLNAAELSGFNTPLGVGDPVHAGDPAGLVFGAAEAKLAGYWRIEQAPTGLDSRLPALRFEPGPDGGIWLATPDVKLLGEVLGDRLPALVESWTWPDSRRGLDATYKVLRGALNATEDRAGEPGARIARKTVKRIYTSLIGNLANTQGPRGAGDVLWRPDWRDMVISQSYANMYRQLRKIGAQSGRFPVAVDADSAYFTTDDNDPMAGAPGGMTFGSGGGKWKPEGTVPLAAIREHAGAKRFLWAFSDETARYAGKVK